MSETATTYYERGKKTNLERNLCTALRNRFNHQAMSEAATILFKV